MKIELSGKWKGKYWFGNGYPKANQDQYHDFELDCKFENNQIEGYCIDPCTINVIGNIATITGQFENDHIRFSKAYSIPSTIDVDGQIELQTNEDFKVLSLIYQGKLIKDSLNDNLTYAGSWMLCCQNKITENHINDYIFEGVWEMTKID